MTKQNFCPIIQGKCREDCTWYHVFTTITPDGIDRNDYCAISVIANRLCDLAEYGEQDD